MRQKATWIIPGILVTLLLGLLWAMPAFAAEAGSVEFKASDASDADDITYVSLNGPAANGSGIWFQVTDSDLDKIVSVKHAGTIDNGATPDPDEVGAPAGTSWFDLQNLDSNAAIDSRDFKLYSGLGLDEFEGGDEVEHEGGSVTYNAATGEITVNDGGGASIVGIEYKIKIIETLGARAASSETASVEYNANTAASHEAPIPVPADANTGSTLPAFDLVFGEETTGAGTANWLDILETVIPGIKTMPSDDDGIDANADPPITAETRREAVAKAIRPHLEAYNTDDTSKAELNIQVTAYTADTVDDPDTETDENEDAGDTDESRVTITVNDVAATADGGGKALCVGNVGEILKQTTAEPPVAIAPEARVCATPAVDSTVTVEFNYKGSAATVYPASGRIGDEDDVGRVTVDSSGAAQSISVLLKETGASTGVFGTNLMICNATTCGDTAKQIDETAGSTGMVTVPVEEAGDTIKISYRDGSPRGTRTATIALDPSGPSFSGMAPASGTAGREDEPTVSFEVIDGESGLTDDDDNLDSIYVVAGLYELDTSEAVDFVVYERDEIRLDEVSNGYAVSVTIDEGSDEGDELDSGDRDEYEIRWWAVAVDMAGNVGVSDQDGDTKCSPPDVPSVSGLEFNDDERSLAEQEDMAEAIIGMLERTIDDMDDDDDKNDVGCDASVIRVDSAAPELSGATTGVYLDGKDEKLGSVTSIVAIFTEALDCDTVTADDFLVDDVAPNAVTCKGNKVYLSVDEMDSNDTPEIEVAEGAVSDSAGNPTIEDKAVDADDGIPAGLSVTVEGTTMGDRPITDETITITVSSDERLSGRPLVTIRSVGEDYKLDDPVHDRELTSTGNDNEWGDDFDLPDAGLYNVLVTAVDRVDSGDSIAGLSGQVKDKDGKDVEGEFELDKDDLKGDKAILFEVDNAVSTPDFTPEADDDGNRSTDNPDLFIRVDFADEGNEYGLVVKCTDEEGVTSTPNADGKCDEGSTKSNTGEATTTPGDAATDFDTSGLVEITKATFDGNALDVDNDIITRDWVLFVYRPGGLTDGDYKLEIEVMDKAGNEDEFSFEFSKVARKAYKLELNPGPNLISFPANPVDGDINAVFGGAGNEDIMSVVTFDNATGLWMTATRGADGMFMGDLTTVDAMHGYWVVSDGVLDLAVTLSPGNVIGTPPFIAVQKGWNLVPVIDSAQSKAGTGIATNEYFANIKAEVVYGYNSLDGTLVRLSTAEEEDVDDQDMVETGSAYWVYANEAGIIIP